MFRLGILTLILSMSFYYIINNLVSLCDIVQFIHYKHCQTKLDSITTNNTGSSLWCKEDFDNHKICEFHNLCYLPKSENQFLFIYTNNSVIMGLKSKEQLKTISLSSVSNHNGVLLKLTIVNSYENLLQNVLNINENMLILWRFKSDNIMHVIHDDLIPIFMTYRRICKGNIKKCVSKYRLGFVDGGKPGPYYDWYTIFSNSKPLILNKEKYQTICFKNGRIGLSTESVWYQYGFREVQGPTNTNMDGNLLKEFTEFVLQKFKINKKKNDINMSMGILFNRKINRRIINDNYVIDEMRNSYKNIFTNKTLDIYNLDLSQNDTFTILSLLTQANIVVGMHGSVMILSMFLPSSACIVELFPFGIQPEHVSPLRAMCDLPGVFQHYISWTNPKESNSVVYPNNPPLLGGISHLSIEMQQDLMKIKLVPPVECCHNPLYLYRMYQDTIVDNSFPNIIQDALLVQKTMSSNDHSHYLYNKNDFERWYFPSAVTNITCFSSQNDFTLSWNKPHNVNSQSVEYKLAIKLGNRDISLTTSSTAININMSFVKNTIVQVWIKSKVDSNESIDTYSKCELVSGSTVT